MLRALVGGLLVGLTLNVTMGLAAAGVPDKATDGLTTRLMTLHRLSYGSTRLTATGPTFASGSVGMTMGYPTAGGGSAFSHRADNFTETVQ